MAGQQIWRKSARSQNNQNCVELNDTLDHLRDSKNTAGPALRADVPALLRTIRAGRLDRR